MALSNSPAGFARSALPLFSSAVADQVVLSLTNFLVGFVLIRYARDQDYALYVLVQSALLLLITIQVAYLTQPLIVLTPKQAPEERWQTLGGVKVVQRRILRLIALPLLAVPVLGYLHGNFSALLAVVVAVGIIASWAGLRREYMRSVLLICARPHDLLMADSVYAVVLLLGVAVAVLSGHEIVVGATVSLVLAAWAGAAVAHRSFSISPGWRPDGSVTVWPQIRSLGFWSVLGATIYWFLGQSYSYVLALRLDLTAVADVNATRLLLMPAFVLTIGLISLLGPTVSAWYVEMGVHRLIRRLVIVLIAVGLIDAAYFLIVWFNRNWLIADVMHKTVLDKDRLLVLWGAVVVVSLLRDVLQCALIAMGHLRALAWQVGISAALALLVMWFGMYWWGEASVLIGQIVGELVNLIGILFLLRKYVQNAPPDLEPAAQA